MPIKPTREFNQKHLKRFTECTASSETNIDKAIEHLGTAIAELRIMRDCAKSMEAGVTVRDLDCKIESLSMAHSIILSR